MTKKDLIALTVTGLKALARKNNVVLAAGAKKTDLIAALLKSPGAEKSAKAAGSTPVKKAVAKKQSTKKAAAKKAPVKRSVSTDKKAAPKKATAPIIQKTVVAKIEATTSTPAKASRRTWVVPVSEQEPFPAEQKVADAKYYTGPEADHAQRSSDKLPAGYGEDRITLMARDPSLTYAYWEATPERLVKERSWFGMEAALVIRIYDVTGVQFDGRNAIGYFDQEIADLAGSWYFETGRPGHSFCADLGIRSREGRFLTLARSNYITMPRDGVSDVIDEEWMLADEEFWQLYGFPDGISSPQVQELWRRRYQREISSPGLYSRAKGKSK